MMPATSKVNWHDPTTWEDDDYQQALLELGTLRMLERKQAKSNVPCCCCTKRATRMLRTATLCSCLLVAVAVAACFTFLVSSGTYSAISTRQIVLDYPCNASQPELVVSRPGVARAELNLTAYLSSDLTEGSADNLAIFDFDDRRCVHRSSTEPPTRAASVSIVFCF